MNDELSINAQQPTTNNQRSSSDVLSLDVGRWMLDVGRSCTCRQTLTAFTAFLLAVFCVQTHAGDYTIFKGDGSDEPGFVPPPRKMRLGALKGALSFKLREGKLQVVKDFELQEIKTKKLVEVLGKLKVDSGALIVDGDNDKLRLSARNLQNHSVLPPEGVNLYDLLRHEHLVLTENAVEALEARCQ